jgi:hypothetical protein
MSFIKYSLNLVMAGLFIFTFVMFATNFATENQAPFSLVDDPAYSSLKDQIESNLSTYSGDVNSSSEILSQSTINAGDETTSSGGLFTGGLSNTKNFAKSSLNASFKKLFGNDPNFGIILNTLIAILVFLGIMYAWQAWAGRSP